jgi:hypothetical protein
MCIGFVCVCVWMVIVTLHGSNNIKSDLSISYVIGSIYKAVPQLRRLTSVCVECQKFSRIQMSPPPARSGFEGITAVNTHTAVYTCVSTAPCSLLDQNAKTVYRLTVSSDGCLASDV